MKVSITLNKDIQCEYICSQVQKLVTQFQKNSQDISRAVLVIDIVTITDSNDSLIPKIEYMPDSST